MGYSSAVLAIGAILSLWSFCGGISTASASEAISLKVGQAQSLKLSGQAHTVTVGDADIASASIAFADTLMLIGRNPGTTNLVALDAEGREIENATLRVVRADGLQAIDILRAGSRQTYLCGPEPSCLFVPPETQTVEYDQTSDPGRSATTAPD